MPKHAPVVASAQMLCLTGCFQVVCACVCGDPECCHLRDVYVSELQHMPSRRVVDA